MAPTGTDYIWAVPEGQQPTYVVKLRDFGSGVVEATATTTTWRSPPYEGYCRIKEVPPVATDQEIEDRRLANCARSARRARQNLRWRLLSLGADRMWTFTYRANVTDLVGVKADWDAFRRLMACPPAAPLPGCGSSDWRRFRAVLGRSPWQYVAVPERQERGAWHIHCGARGWLPVNAVRACWRAVVGEGNVDVAYRSKKQDGSGSRQRLVRYLSKYLGKTFADAELGDDVPMYRRYWSTRSINIPMVPVFIAAPDLSAMVYAVYDLLLARGATGRFSTFLSDDWGCFWCSSA